MSLEDGQRLEIIALGEEGEITPDTTAQEFRGAINDIKWIELDKEDVEDTTIIPVKNPLHENSKFAAEAIRSAANMSHRSKPFLEAYSSIQKGIEILRDEDIITLDAVERKEVAALILTQYEELSSIVKNFI